MKLGILGTGMIVREFLPWLTGADSPFTVQCICSTQRSAEAAGELCEQYGRRVATPEEARALLKLGAPGSLA